MTLKGAMVPKTCRSVAFFTEAMGMYIPSSSFSRG